ncbi:MAG: hypothetical protein A3K19_06400 [Lentisphaerae bacterium RIFOXYB12_FULL_65_16]|nr:MAG: hypothetical protein A3K18_10035 [Lentisphaerae bacterium RIFOXYA12_64_32]OGV93813.1 MAG: hypothetical protein A3K19_06400 [Lentisphaerae bacterium RIFOXYB12_FULL_65_16]
MEYIGLFFRLVAAWLLLFLSGGLAGAILALPGQLHRQAVLMPAGIGFLSGAIVFALVCRFTPVYVLGHELTHWFTAKLFLRQTGTLEVSASKGSVAVSGANVWIVLAPYFVPIYTLLWIGIYGVLCFWVRTPGPIVTHVFYAGLGVTYAFHVVLTAWALYQGQQDLSLYGAFFSLAIILFCNLLLVFLSVIVAARAWTPGMAAFLDVLRAEGQVLAACVEGCRRLFSR